LTLNGFSEYLLENPENYGPAPTNNQVLTYSASLGKPIWEDAGDLGAAVVYVTTNSAVQAAPGSTTSAKISNALGGVTPSEADSAIVQGSPGDTYQGLYLFNSGVWTFAAGYADPTALQVPYNNTVSGLVATTVQAAIDELNESKLDSASNSPAPGQILSWGGGAPLWVDPSASYPTASEVSFDPSGTDLPPFADTVQEALTLTWVLADGAQTDATQALTDASAAQVTANLALGNANDAVDTADNALAEALDAVNTANDALAVANDALPTTGGTMTGDIVFNGGQPVDAGTF
jgi:hypothetical protein